MALMLYGCGDSAHAPVIDKATGSSAPPPVRERVSPDKRHVTVTPLPTGRYIVQRGESVYAIAFRYGLDYRQLAQWNGINPPYVIYPGQSLTLHRPSATSEPSAPEASKAASAR